MNRFRSVGIALAAASLLTVALAGCVPVITSGPMTSQEREIDAVTTIVLDTSGDLTISQGEPSLIIHAPADALDRLTSAVNGDTLVLGSTGFSGLQSVNLRYEVTLPDLEALELNGSGDITATVPGQGTIRIDLNGSGDATWTGLDTVRTEVSHTGSGSIQLEGATKQLSIDCYGSGDTDALGMQAQDASVAITGSGSIRVAVSGTLTAEVSGSGQVSYSGDPEVATDVSGSGTVNRE